MRGSQTFPEIADEIMGVGGWQCQIVPQKEIYVCGSMSSLRTGMLVYIF
jgi:hypothetical protein